MTAACQTSKVGEIGGTFLVGYSRVVAQWRAIVLLLILPCVVFLEARFDEFARFDLILLALLLIFIASQISGLDASSKSESDSFLEDHGESGSH